MTIRLVVVGALFWFILTDVVYGDIGTWSGSVNAQNGPDSPIRTMLTAGKRELVTVTVTGQIKLGEAPLSGPAGSGYYGYENSKPPHGYTHGIVMMKINENHIPIEGGARTLESPHAGPLSLYVNDDNSTDNQGAFNVTIVIESAIVGDADEDGLDDALEDELLDQYAPEIKFDSDEFVRPADVYWYLRNCDLLVSGDEDSRKIIDRKQVPYHLVWFLRQISQDGRSTNYLDVRSLVLTYCNIHNPRRYGDPDWGRVLAAQNTGVYGHVVPVSDALILLQYWMFYGWNSVDAPINAGDHEGDWELFEVYLDRNDPKNVNNMKKAAWYAHGESPYLFAWENGSWYQHPSATLIGTPPSMPQAHPPIYVESGTHGSWPAFGSYTGVGKNRGNGHSYVPANVPNIGEIYRPRLGSEVILQFNGRWGAFKCCLFLVTTPEGPILQSQWRHSPGTNSEALYVGRWNAGPDDSYRNGRISWPWANVEQAVSATSDSQTILIYPGSYSAGAEISKPVMLKAPHGNVVISR